MTVGERIRIARKEKGLTQKALGEACGIAEPTIRRYELGKLNPKYETLQKIAEAVSFPIDFFLGAPPFDNPEFLLSEKGKNLITAAMHSHLGEMDNINWEKIQENKILYVRLIDCIVDSIEVNEKEREISIHYYIGHENEPYARVAAIMQRLNEHGKDKAVEAVEKLAQIPEYQKKPPEGREAPHKDTSQDK